MADAKRQKTEAAPTPASSRWRLCGRRALITGSTKGIGLATAREFLALGASVIVSARSEAQVAALVAELNQKHAREAGVAELVTPRVFGCAVDVATDAGRAALVAFTTKTWGGGLDILVNNVGTNIRARCDEATEKDYRTMMSTNVDSTYFLSQALYPHLCRGANPCVVNISSAAGLTSTGTGAIYAMTKAAMVQLTKNLAVEWARNAIRVNCVAPWMCMTPLLAEAVKDDPSALEKVGAATPLSRGLKRLPAAEESASTIAFLAMPAASYISGQTLSVDGAFSASGFLGPCVE